jgi:hypothetical protein
MAKKGGKSSGAVSKGERRSSIKTSGVGITEVQKMLNKQRAFFKGSDPWVTVANPNKSETNKPFIKVRMSTLRGGSANDVKKRAYVMK